MTRQFILDENVMILAARGRTAQGESNKDCLKLFTDIITICHSLVIDYALWAKYQRQLSSTSFQGNREGSQMLAVLASSIRRTGKLLIGPDAKSFPEEDTVPQGSQDDVPLVRLAIESGATLVTTDEALIQDLSTCGVDTMYGLSLVSPKSALESL